VTDSCTEEAAEGCRSGGSSVRKKEVLRRRSASHQRYTPIFASAVADYADVMTDLEHLSLGDTMELKRELDNYKNFSLAIKPDEGMYKGGQFEFAFEIKPTFPYDAPKVRCMQKIYHPNIDLEGNVCLNILREDWKPVLNLNAIFFGVQVRIDQFSVRSRG
jgi:ubiquitin-protein ligase